MGCDTVYIHTTKIVLADLLSRSFTETGEDIEAVLVEFRAEVQKLDLTAVETLVPPQLLAKLLQQNLESCGVEQLEQYATESWGLIDPTPEGEVSRQDRLAINAFSMVALQPPSESASATSEVVACGTWRSPRDEGEPQELNVTLGGKRKVVGFAKSPAEAKPDEEDEYEVERIIQHRIHEKHGLQFRVRWKGFNNTRNSWVNAADCHSPDLVQEFENVCRNRGGLLHIMTDTAMTDAVAEKFYYGDRAAA